MSDTPLPWYKEPLLHFLIFGSLLFAIFTFTQGEEEWGEDASTIVVDEDALLEFMQFRAQAFKPEIFKQRLADMPTPEKQKLINDYVQEEVMYREALAMGMDKSDYIIRRRLVQKIDFINQDLSKVEIEPTAEQLAQHYAQNKEDYLQPPLVTFTHIFFSEQRRDNAQQDAIERYNQLTANPISFEDALTEGDWFTFHRNYVERTEEYVANHFGKHFAADLYATEGEGWLAPIQSEFGWHLVLIGERTATQQLTLEDVQAQVREKWISDEAERRAQKSLQVLVDSYTVNIEL